jgi:CP family cyanate transporter-like MFS transporter
VTTIATVAVEEPPAGTRASSPERPADPARQSASGAILLGLAWLVAFNLQSGLVALGPVLPALVADLSLSNTVAGALAAVPMLMMGLVAVAGGRLADRWGARRTLALGLALLAAGGGLRAAATGWLLLLGFSILFGVGIGIAQPALPRLTRTAFPGRLGLATGVYTSGLIAGQVLAAAITGPLLVPAFGWRGALALWGVVAATALAPWLLLAKPASPAAAAVVPGAAGGGWSPWRDRRIWVISLLYVGQGLTYLLLATWLPAIYGDLGVDAAGAGARLALLAGSCLPAGLLLPTLSDRIGSRRLPLLASGLLTLAATLGLATAPVAPGWSWAWPLLAGVGTSGVFVLCLVQIAEAPPAGSTGAAAGMMMAVGYGGAVLGPVAAGALRDATGGFAFVLLLLPAVALAMTLLALVTPETAPSKR